MNPLDKYLDGKKKYLQNSDGYYYIFDSVQKDYSMIRNTIVVKTEEFPINTTIDKINIDNTTIDNTTIDNTNIDNTTIDKINIDINLIK